jgi:predicted nucleic acid-binding protein
VIVLDTNVLSALMQKVPDRAIAAWVDIQPRLSLWTTSVTVYEIQGGIEVMTPGRRRRELENAFKQLSEELFEGRFLPFDFDAAIEAAEIAAHQRRSGRPVEIRDVQIAGIVRLAKATLATRNTRHFDGIGLSLVNPWSV